MIATLFLTYIIKSVTKFTKIELVCRLISMIFSTAMLRTPISSLDPSH